MVAVRLQRPHMHSPTAPRSGMRAESGIDMACKEDYLSPEEFRQVPCPGPAPAVLCRAVPCCAVPCLAVPCCAVLAPMPCCAITDVQGCMGEAAPLQ